MAPPPRRCIVLRGTPESTLAASVELCARLDRVLHVRSAAEARRALGSGWQAVVLDLHDSLDADVFGMCHGLVIGGGALVLRMPPDGPPADPRQAVFPHDRRAVGRRFARRLMRHLEAIDTTPRPLVPCEVPDSGNEEQREVVRRLEQALDGPPGTLVTLLAPRGRGKSTALGLATAQLNGRTAVVTSMRSAAVVEVRRRAPDVPWVPIDALESDTSPEVILVDEAATVSVPALQRLILAHPQARIVLSTTTQGYEGTGRGFTLRFLPWLRGLGRPLTELTLSQPLRWAPDDPLERFVLDVLALDAEPARVGSLGELHAERLDRDALASDEGLLRRVFGLLVQAHYRTTPGDLQRILDAPNLELHALFSGDRVVGATLLAHEGGLPPEMALRMQSGAERIRGHALADTLVCHAGAIEAAPLRMVRSMRLAVHPDHRRAGLGRRLVEHVHEAHHPDLFGTVFSGRAEVLRFRRQLGYAFVRLGTARGARTGEPAAVMIRPVSEAARVLVAHLRRQLAQELPLQLALLEADGMPLSPALVGALLADLPSPGPVFEAERDEAIRRWLHGAGPYEASAWAVEDRVRAHVDRLDCLSASDRAVVEGRVLHRRGWRELARALGHPGVPATMRALKQAVSALVSEPGG